MSKPQIRPTRRVRGRDLDGHRDMLAEADSDYGAEMRRSKLMDPERWWESPILAAIEKRMERHTKHLPKHPKGRTLPCWCQECVREDVA